MRRAGWLSLFPAIVLCSVVLAGCGTTPSPPPGPAGFVTVELVTAPGGGAAFFEAIHRAEAIDERGTVVVAWQVMDTAVPVEVPPGRYRLRVFTVFLGDTLECVLDPVAPGGSRCGQPTLGPSQVCALDIVVQATTETRARFHVLREGLCGLEAADAS